MTKTKLKKLCEHLRSLQRNRETFIRSRNKLENRVTAIVAGQLGYNPSLEKSKRDAFWKEARETIKAIQDGAEHDCQDLVLTSYIGIAAFQNRVASYEAEMEELATKLPVYEWSCQPDQHGFGKLSLAKIIGECGNLSDYSNPGKVWKRMGCVPISCEGETRMPKAWGSERMRPFKLPKEVWLTFGYSPRRRSVMFVLTDSMLKLNGKCKDEAGIVYVGPYRQRYIDARERFDELHPECKKDGQKRRSQRHGELLAAKLLLKNLWNEWNDYPPHIIPSAPPKKKPEKRRKSKSAV